MFKDKEKRVKFLSITILVVAFFLVLKLINRPYMSFVVKYADIPAVSKNLLFFPIDVHFRGV